MKKTFIFIITLLVLFSINSYSQSIQWVTRMGGQLSDINSFWPDEKVQDMQIDADGNVYACGRVMALADFNGLPVTAYGYYDIFLVKYNCQGTLQWVKTAGCVFYDEAWGIELDKFGHIYLAGYLDGGNNDTTYFFDSTFVIHDPEMFLAKFDTSGNYLWGKISGVPGTPAYAYGKGLKLDHDGNPIVYLETALPGILFPGWPTIDNPYFAKFDTSGTLQQLFSFSPNRSVGPKDFVIDSQNNYVFTGSFTSDSVMIGNQIFYNTQPANSEVFFTGKFSPTGQLLWLYEFTDTLTRISGGTGYGIITDNNDNIFVMGTVNKGLKCGNFIFTDSISPNSSFSFVIKLNSSGQPIWATQGQSSYSQISEGKLALKSNGNIVFSGQFAGMSVFGPDTLTNYSTSINNTFIAEVDPNGTMLGAIRLDGTGDYNKAVCTKVDINDNVYVGGGFDGYLYYNSTNVLSGGGYTDGFILKYGSICTVGVNELNKNPEALQIYPNPSREIITINYQKTENASIEIYDAIGKLILKQQINNSSDQTTINISNFPQGIYIVRLLSKQKQINSKFIKE